MARSRRGRQRKIVAARQLNDEQDANDADSEREGKSRSGRRRRTRTRGRKSRNGRRERGSRNGRRRRRRSRRSPSEPRTRAVASKRGDTAPAKDEETARTERAGRADRSDRDDLRPSEALEAELSERAAHGDDVAASLADDDAEPPPLPSGDGELFEYDPELEELDELDEHERLEELESDSDEEDDTLLDQVRTALDGAQSATAQADYTLRGIGQELRSISQRQAEYEGKAVLNSVFAYIIFCALIFGALYFVFDLRSQKNAVDERYYETELERQSERLALLETELEKYRKGAHVAFEVYQLTEQARYDEALERYNEVRDHIINPAEAALLETQIDKAQWELAERAYRDGLELYDNETYEQARDAFFTSLSYQKHTPFTHLLHYHLGMSLFHLGDFNGARHYLDEGLKADLPRALEAEARYHYAVATQNVGLDDEAFELYEKFVKLNRYHEHADKAQRRMSRIERAKQRERIAARRAARERAQKKKEAEEGN